VPGRVELEGVDEQAAAAQEAPLAPCVCARLRRGCARVEELEAQLTAWGANYDKLCGELSRARVEGARRDAEVEWLEGGLG